MYLYHGIILDYFNSMKEFGVNSNSYWGEESEAIKYSDCNRVIKIQVDDGKYTIRPNLNMVEAYISAGDIDLINEWENSDKKWTDSLKIFGSVIIEETVFFDEDFDIIYGE